MKLQGLFSSDFNDLDDGEPLDKKWLFLIIDKTQRRKVERWVQGLMPNSPNPIYPTQNKYVNKALEVAKFKVIKYVHCERKVLVEKDGHQETQRQICTLKDMLNRTVEITFKYKKFNFKSTRKENFGMQMRGINITAIEIQEI